MKQTLFVFALVFGICPANAQFFTIPDTLLIQTFTVDPSSTMLAFPSGNDAHWVNWDADNLATVCGEDEPVPRNWYWENDLGDLANPPVNFAFTSCSFLEDSELPNENWLITPPVFISDSTAVLTWRSSPFEGPGYMDGYKVLVSTSSNEPFVGAFTDTLFVAAEMTGILNAGSLDPNDYVFSNGYIHANGYTNTDYFFLIHPNAKAYTGRLEPHAASLANYVGRSIYIAFLHDSTNDNILQLDDIAIVEALSSSTDSPGRAGPNLRVLPNPVADQATISWGHRAAQTGLLSISDILGKTLLEQALKDLSTGYIKLDLSGIPAGTYTCTLSTRDGRQSAIVVKR